MNKEQLALNITKALAYTENGGKPKTAKAGKSGELKSIWQFTPSTWKLYSKQVTGEELPLTTEAEAYVVHKKVTDWVDHLETEGVPEEEIPLKVASMWNAGERKPDAYKQNHVGTNKFGVHYDTPAYAQKVANYVKEFSKEGERNPQLVQSDTTSPQSISKVNLSGKMSGLFGGNANVAPVKSIGGLIQQSQGVS